MSPAPLYVMTHDLARWVLTNLPPGSPLARRAHSDCLDLLDHVVLALKGCDRDHHLDLADQANALLRVRLHLARDLSLIDDRQLLFLADQLDQIGRQIGGWMRALARESGGRQADVRASDLSAHR